MGGALIFGVILAERRRYGAHGACQSTVLLLNLWMIGFEMRTSLRLQLAPHLQRFPYRLLHNPHDSYGSWHSSRTTGNMHRAYRRNRILFPVTALHAVEAMDADKTDALVARPDLKGIGTFYEWYVVPLRCTQVALERRPGELCTNKRSERPPLGYSTEVANPKPVSRPEAAALICRIPRMTTSGRSIMTTCPLSRAMIL